MGEEGVSSNRRRGPVEIEILAAMLDLYARGLFKISRWQKRCTLKEVLRRKIAYGTSI